MLVNLKVLSYCCSAYRSKDNWIIDSGAWDHICNSMNWFKRHKKINPINVQLPNESFARVEIAAEVHIFGFLILHNVLYLPQFNFNLISISKLAKLNYCFSLSGDVCYIQDSQKKVIGSGKLKQGLYHIEDSTNNIDKDFITSANSVSSTFCSAVSVPESALWHFRLGHVAQPVLAKLS